MLIAGLYRGGAIVLPDPKQKQEDCGDAFKHEVIHYLLDVHGKRDSQHLTDVWGCQ